MSESQAELLISSIRMMAKDLLGARMELDDLDPTEVAESLNHRFDEGDMPLIEAIMEEAGFTGWLTDKIGRRFYFVNGKRQSGNAQSKQSAQSVAKGEVAAQGLDPKQHNVDQYQGPKDFSEDFGKRAKKGELTPEEEGKFDEWVRQNKEAWDRVKGSAAEAKAGKTTVDSIDQFTAMMDKAAGELGKAVTVAKLKQFVRELAPQAKENFGYSGMKKEDLIGRVKDLVEKLGQANTNGELDKYAEDDAAAKWMTGEGGNTQPEEQTSQDPIETESQQDVEVGDQEVQPEEQSQEPEIQDDQAGESPVDDLVQDEAQDTAQDEAQDTPQPKESKPLHKERLASLKGAYKDNPADTEFLDRVIAGEDPEVVASEVGGVTKGLAKTAQNIIAEEYKNAGIDQPEYGKSDEPTQDAVKPEVEDPQETKSDFDVKSIDSQSYYRDSKNRLEEYKNSSNNEDFRNAMDRVIENAMLEDPPEGLKPEMLSEFNLDTRRDFSMELVWAWKEETNPEAKQELEKVMQEMGLEKVGNNGWEINSQRGKYRIVEPTQDVNEPQSEEPQVDTEDAQAEEQPPEEIQPEQDQMQSFSSDNMDFDEKVTADQVLGMRDKEFGSVLGTMSHEEKLELADELSSKGDELSKQLEKEGKELRDSEELKKINALYDQVVNASIKDAPEDFNDLEDEEDAQPEGGQEQPEEEPEFDKGEAEPLQGQDAAEDDATNFKYMTDEEFAKEDPSSKGFELKDGDWVHKDYPDVSFKDRGSSQAEPTEVKPEQDAQDAIDDAKADGDLPDNLDNQEADYNQLVKKSEENILDSMKSLGVTDFESIDVGELQERSGIDSGIVKQSLLNLWKDGKVKLHAYTLPIYRMSPEMQKSSFVFDDEVRGHVTFGKGEASSLKMPKELLIPHKKESKEQFNSWVEKIEKEVFDFYSKNPGKQLSFPDLYRKISDKHSIYQFHDALGVLKKNGKIKLGSFNDPLRKMRDQHFALISDGEINYFIEPN